MLPNAIKNKLKAPADANKLPLERLNSPFAQWWFRTVRDGLALYMRFKFHIRTEGLEQLPKQPGSFIVASTHVSNWDPPLVAHVVRPHHVSFMAKQELFDVPVLGLGIYHLCTFSVNRQKLEVASIRSAKAAMQHPYWVLGMFPEGTRQQEGAASVGDAKKGVGVLATMGKQPVLPIGVSRGGVNGKHFAVSILPLVEYKPEEKADAYAERIIEALKAAKQASLELLNTP